MRLATGDQAIIDWLRGTADYGGFQVVEHHSDADAVQIVLGAHKCMREERDRAISLIQLLVQELKILRPHIANLNPPETPTQRLYRKVRLQQDCPELPLRATQKAFRTNFHRNDRPQSHRAEAERRFKETEAMFDGIERLRAR